MRGDFSARERATNTNAASGPGHPHGHDPSQDRLAACPSEPLSPAVRECRAEYGCLWTGQENGRDLPKSYESGARIMSGAPAGFETLCPEVPVKSKASTFVVLAFVISKMGGILCTHRPNTKAK